MKLETADILDLQIPSDDGAIARALANLETKLADWTAYIEGVQDKLVDRMPARAEASIAPKPNAELTVAETAVASDRVGVPNLETDALTDEIENDLTSPEGHEPSAPKSDAVSDTETQTPSSDVESAITDALRTANETDDERESASQTVESDGQPEDEEALLKALPPNVANDIRVQYRFYDGRKSLQELIATYQAKPKNEKNSWWKRTKG